uniref:Uncharacterized protein n=1 Tax=Arundo donax TaxID=35708 RepID=A0A0A9DHV7_ARUDO
MGFLETVSSMMVNNLINKGSLSHDVSIMEPKICFTASLEYFSVSFLGVDEICSTGILSPQHNHHMFVCVDWHICCSRQDPLGTRAS